jgi:UDP-glucose 4-epimerase
MIPIKGKRFVVTGGAGFLGSHMCDALLSHGAKVTAIDDLSNGKLSNIDHLKRNPSFAFVRADVNDHRAVARCFVRVKPEYVMHYAAMVGVKRTGRDPLGVFRDFDGIRNIAELSRMHGVRKILFTSSSEVYGEPLKTPTTEDDRLGSQWPYGLVKILGEQYLQSFGAEHGIGTTILRFFNVYGPRQDFGESGFVVPIFLRDAMAGKPLLLYGGGHQTRDFVYVKDNIRLTLKAFRTPAVDGRPMNIGTGHSIRVVDLANAVIGLGLPTKIKKMPARSHGEITYRVPHVEFMLSALHDRPTTSLRDGLTETVEYMKSLNPRT